MKSKTITLLFILFVFAISANSEEKNGLDFSVRDHPEKIKEFDFEKLVQTRDTLQYIEALRRLCDVDAAHINDQRLVTKYFIPIISRIITDLASDTELLKPLAKGREVNIQQRYNIAFDFLNVPQANRKLYSLVDVGRHILDYLNFMEFSSQLSKVATVNDGSFNLLLIEDDLYGYAAGACMENYLYPFYNNRPALDKYTTSKILQYAGFRPEDVAEITFFELKEAIDRQLWNDLNNNRAAIENIIVDITTMFEAVSSGSYADYVSMYPLIIMTVNPYLNNYLNQVLSQYNSKVTGNFFSGFQEGMVSAINLEVRRNADIDKLYINLKHDFLVKKKKFRTFPSSSDAEKFDDPLYKNYWDLYLKISYYILKNASLISSFVGDKSGLLKFIEAESKNIGHENFSAFLNDVLFSSCLHYWQYRDVFSLDVLELSVSLMMNEPEFQLESLISAAQIYQMNLMKNRAIQILNFINFGQWIDNVPTEIPEDAAIFVLDVLLSYMITAAECDLDSAGGKTLEEYERVFEEREGRIRKARYREWISMRYLTYKVTRGKYSEALSGIEEIYPTASAEIRKDLDITRFESLFRLVRYRELHPYLTAIMTSDDINRDAEYYSQLTVANAYCDKTAMPSLVDSLSVSVRRRLRSHFLVVSEQDREDIHEQLRSIISPLSIMQNDLDEEDVTAYLSGFLYDWTLVSKGLLLETNEFMEEYFRNSDDTDVKNVYRALKSLSPIIDYLTLKDGGPADKAMVMMMSETMHHSLQEYLTGRIDIDAFSSHISTNWRDIRGCLKEKDIAIEFVRIEKDSDAFYSALVLSPTSKYPDIVKICSESQIRKAVGALSDNRIYSNRYVSHKLYNLIWGPLSESLSGAENIYFSVDGMLHQMNIEALMMNDGDLMCDAKNVIRLSSTRELLKDSRPAISKAVLYGGLNYNIGGDEVQEENPDIRGSISAGIVPTNSLTAETLPEIRYIREQLLQMGVSVDTLVGNKGREETFKNLSGSDVNLIHMATHGFFFDGITEYQSNRENILPPMLRSGLEMSRRKDVVSGEEDGLLLASEIAVMDLHNVSLFVMSACETGKGSILGDGVFGLQRGLKQAGVGTIIMTLWKVNSRIAQIFMQEFYRSYAVSADVHASFRLARQKAAETDPQSDWSAFIMLD